MTLAAAAPADLIAAHDDLMELADAAAELGTRAESLHMKATARECQRISHSCKAAASRVRVQPGYLTSSLIWLETCANTLTDLACRVGKGSH